MKNFSVGMALTDYVPVIFFLIASIILQRDLYNKMSKGAFALFAAGTIDVFCAGALKATYKLFYALCICDFEVLSQLFFPLQAIGFMLAGAGIIALTFYKQGKSCKLYSVAAAPVAFHGTMLFVTFMCLGLAGMNTGFCVISVKMKKISAVICFILSFFFSLAMGYMSSKDFAQAYMNWIAQGINIIGQGTMLLGAVILHNAGLKDLCLQKRRVEK